jgi:hypothetical protein
MNIIKYEICLFLISISISLFAIAKTYRFENHSDYPVGFVAYNGTTPVASCPGSKCQNIEKGKGETFEAPAITKFSVTTDVPISEVVDQGGKALGDFTTLMQTFAFIGKKLVQGKLPDPFLKQQKGAIFTFGDYACKNCKIDNGILSCDCAFYDDIMSYSPSSVPLNSCPSKNFKLIGDKNVGGKLACA